MKTTESTDLTVYLDIIKDLIIFKLEKDNMNLCDENLKLIDEKCSRNIEFIKSTVEMKEFYKKSLIKECQYIKTVIFLLN
jgi:hypothetical protein